MSELITENKIIKMSLLEFKKIKELAFEEGRKSVFLDIDKLRNCCPNDVENELVIENDSDGSDDEPELNFKQARSNPFSPLAKKISTEPPSKAIHSKNHWNSKETRYYMKS